jgi:hypothetical protein
MNGISFLAEALILFTLPLFVQIGSQMQATPD